MKERAGTVIGHWEEGVVRLNPNDLASLNNLGSLYLAKGQADKARVLFESALALDSEDPVAHKNLGIICQGFLKEPTKAVIRYKRYLELGPDSDQEMIRKYIRDVEGAAPKP